VSLLDPEGQTCLRRRSLVRHNPDPHPVLAVATTSPRTRRQEAGQSAQAQCPTPVPTSLNWKQAQTRVAFAMLICMVAALFTASNHALYDSRAILELTLPAAAFLCQAYTMIRAYPANWVRFFGTLIAIVLIDCSVVYYCLIVL
jgi:hypothetical protein